MIPLAFDHLMRELVDLCVVSITMISNVVVLDDLAKWEHIQAKQKRAKN